MCKKEKGNKSGQLETIDQTEEQIGSTESCKFGVQLPVPKGQGRYRLVNNMIEQLKFKEI